MPEDVQMDMTELTPEELLLTQWRAVEERRLDIEGKMIALGMEIPERQSALAHKAKPKSIVEASWMASNDMKAGITKANVVAWIEDNAGWKDQVNPNTVTSTLQRLRDDLEIVESIKGGKGKATVYQIPRIFPLSTKQHTRLMKQRPEDRNKGGFQSLIFQLQQSVRQLDEDHWEIRVSDQLLEKVGRYCAKHGGGGWQNLLKEIFADFLSRPDKK